MYVGSLFLYFGKCDIKPVWFHETIIPWMERLDIINTDQTTCQQFHKMLKHDNILEYGGYI